MIIIGERLKKIREQKNLSQGDIEHKTGLLRCYISRVENGHTVPAIETLEKLARALEAPMYQLFYDGEKPPEIPALPKLKKGVANGWAAWQRSASLGSLSLFAKPNGRRRQESAVVSSAEDGIQKQESNSSR